MCSLNKPC